MATYLTQDAARADYLANADYADGAGDAAKAATFRSACRALIVLLPQSAGQGGATLTMSVAQLAAELKTAESFLAARATGSAPRVLHADVSEFRS